MQHTSPAGGPGQEASPHPQPAAAPPEQHSTHSEHAHQGAAHHPPYAEENTGASSGLDPKMASLLAYITWIGGVIILLTQKQPAVKFHGAQSILFNIAVVAAYVILTVANTFASLFIGGWAVSTAFFLAGAALWVGTLALWIVLVVKAYNLKQFKLPLIGSLAEKWTKA